MRKLLSYFWPQTTKIKSTHNGVLEITMVNGKKVLDSENANYSYGSLQRILETGIAKVDLKKIQSVLLLGLGGGSIISSLRNKFNFQGKIHAIELDEKVISIAQDEFNIYSSSQLTITEQDAYVFVQKHSTNYDLIIVDLFIDNVVPSPFYSIEFCQNVSSILNKNGWLIFNLGLHNLNSKGKEQVIANFKSKDFRHTVLTGVEETNTLLIIEKLN